MRLLGENGGAFIFQCTKCGLGKTEGEFPKEFYFDKNKLVYFAYHRDPVYVENKEQFKNIFDKRADIISRFKTKGKALEAGSSTGLLLSLLKDKGWEVLGIEPSQSGASVAIEHGVPTLNTTFELVNLPQRSFDLIIFNHVLEHMENPVLILRKAHKILRKDGLSLIDVPNFASLSARLSGPTWRYILPREHRWHFTPTSLFLLLEKSGFMPVYWEAHSGIWGYGNPLKEIIESFRGRKKRFIWNILTLVPTFILTKFKSGTGLTVIAQKV